MLNIAYKEWAATCKALADGTQTILIRKGGIAETGGVFRPDYSRFWLYPTYYHEQQRLGIKTEFMNYLHLAESEPRTPGSITISHLVEVVEIVFVDKLQDAHRLTPFHIWTPELIEQRFAYRSPGLYVLLVRVRKASPKVLNESPGYLGCKTWVELDETLDDDSQPVLPDHEFAKRLSAIRSRLTESH